MTSDEQAQAWVYYQNLVREHGFEGITDLLAKYDTMRQAAREVLADDRAGLCQSCLIGDSDEWKELARLVTPQIQEKITMNGNTLAAASLDLCLARLEDTRTPLDDREVRAILTNLCKRVDELEAAPMRALKRP